tara:strand:+ start:423 stop:665 length:243 start_codon:yes stop_codon:yes gene_type:complete
MKKKVSIIIRTKNKKNNIRAQENKDDPELIIDGLIPKKLRTENIYKDRIEFNKVESSISFISINKKNINSIMKKVLNISL